MAIKLYTSTYDLPELKRAFERRVPCPSAQPLESALHSGSFLHWLIRVSHSPLAPGMGHLSLYI